MRIMNFEPLSQQSTIPLNDIFYLATKRFSVLVAEGLILLQHPDQVFEWK